MKFTNASFPKKVQLVLEEIRGIIKDIAPDAKEKISCQIAAFELNGRNLIRFAGWKKHVLLYPIPAGSEAFEKQIAPYVDGRGTLKFPLDRPLPMKLIEEIVRLHVAANVKRKKQASE